MVTQVEPLTTKWRERDARVARYAVQVFSCVVSHAALRHCSGGQRPPGNDRMQSWHDARPARGCLLGDASRPRDDVGQLFHSVAPLVRDARES